MRKKKTWFTSDWHLHHKNLLKGERIGIRPFSTLKEMHEELITRHNALVLDTDDVYMLGDVTLEKNPNTESLYLARSFNGNKILIPGNHDHFTVEQYVSFAGFKDVKWFLRVHGFVLSHIPVHPSQFSRFKGNIHGHTHENKIQHTVMVGNRLVGEDDPRYVNACVEVTNYTPISLDDIMSRVDRIKE